MSQEPQERFGLRIREAAEAIGIGMTNTRKLVASGALPSVRIGKRIIITPESIRAFLANAAPTVADSGCRHTTPATRTIMTLPDFDASLPDPAASRRPDPDGALDAVLDGMSYADLLSWVRGNPAVLEAFESDHSDEIADYLADA